jgi:1,4-alpha-glucan branching enzyme
LPGFTGLKYHRITGKGNWKEPYHPGWAQERAATHAGHFMHNRQLQVRWLADRCDAPPIVVAPYDAELFGHWWFEGPQWIDFLLRKMAHDQNDIKATTLGEYRDAFGASDTAAPPECSWGAGGYHEVWLNGSNDWTYPYLHDAALRLATHVNQMPHADGWKRWVLDQAARELLLAQSSDWAFIMKTGTSVEYAVRRFKTHVHRLDRLLTMVETGNHDEAYLRHVAGRDSLFPDMDYRIFQTQPWV